jgi:hypothetical protein
MPVSDWRLDMFLDPCHKCLIELREDCKIKQAKLSLLRGSKINKAQFKCSKLESFLLPGLRISAKFLVLESAGYGYGSYDITIEGTIIGFANRSNKLKIWLDKNPDTRTVVKLWPERLTIDFCQPIKKLCPECGCPEGETNEPREYLGFQGGNPIAWYCETCKTGMEYLDIALGKP